MNVDQLELDEKDSLYMKRAKSAKISKRIWRDLKFSENFKQLKLKSGDCQQIMNELLQEVSEFGREED